MIDTTELEIIGRISDAAFYKGKNNIPIHKEDQLTFVESFRPKQIASKLWLVQELANFKMSYKKVLVLGSWNAILLYELMSKYLQVDWFDFVDKNHQCEVDRDLYFNLAKLEKNYSSIVCPVEQFTEHFEEYDLIINCSCEHMVDQPAIYGPLYALQSNNYTSVEDHINCVTSSEQLAHKNNITDVLYQGDKKFDFYTRYMVIGYYS